MPPVQNVWRPFEASRVRKFSHGRLCYSQIECNTTVQVCLLFGATLLCHSIRSQPSITPDQPLQLASTDAPMRRIASIHPSFETAIADS